MSEFSPVAAGEEHNLEAITFRRYEPADFPRCAEMTVNAWPELAGIGLGRAVMEWYGWPATWKEVACISDTAIGILFGKVNCDLGMVGKLRTRLAHATVYLKLLLGLYGRMPHRLQFVRNGLKDDRNIAANSPEADAEVLYLVVDSAHRKKGIGKKLMSRFIDYAKRRGAKRISVYTTEPGSDWGFYESYGFRKYSSFHDSFMTLLRNEEVKGMIYVFDIQ
ncbi:MAG: GNAT family N-acetyltransferase [Thermoplasmata archaeon]